MTRMVVRILIMVPIYGISSLIAIFSLEAAFVIDVIRDVYEVCLIHFNQGRCFNAYRHLSFTVSSNS